MIFWIGFFGFFGCKYNLSIVSKTKVKEVITLLITLLLRYKTNNYLLSKEYVILQRCLKLFDGMISYWY